MSHFWCTWLLGSLQEAILLLCTHARRAHMRHIQSSRSSRHACTQRSHLMIEVALAFLKMFDRSRVSEIDVLLSVELRIFMAYSYRCLIVVHLPNLKFNATELSDHTPQLLCSASGQETSRPIVAHHAHFPCYMYSLGK